jgi:hypothetical protein
VAHGFRCTKCDHQETEHLYPFENPGVCNHYQSPDQKGEDAIWKAERAENERTAPTSDAVWLLTPYGFVDIGS